MGSTGQFDGLTCWWWVADLRGAARTAGRMRARVEKERIVNECGVIDVTRKSKFGTRTGWVGEHEERVFYALSSVADMADRIPRCPNTEC
jgi:hypothetical protein